MSKHPGNPSSARKKPSKLPVYLSVLLVLASAAAFASAFYLLDGATLVADLLDSFFAEEPATEPGAGPEPTVTPLATSTVTPEGIVLPAGMPLEFALRLWQEQIDSQKNIRHLADGDIESLQISSVERRANRALLSIVARFKDKTSAPGVLEMVQFGENWYFSRVTGLRETQSGGMADDVSGVSTGTGTPLPDIEDVDVDLLNVLLEQQYKSAPVLEEYATGQVFGVRVMKRTAGPGTLTLSIEMDESHETGVGEIVLIEDEVDGAPRWFVARFTKR